MPGPVAGAFSRRGPGETPRARRPPGGQPGAAGAACRFRARDRGHACLRGLHPVVGQDARGVPARRAAGLGPDQLPEPVFRHRRGHRRPRRRGVPDAGAGGRADRRVHLGHDDPGRGRPGRVDRVPELARGGRLGGAAAAQRWPADRRRGAGAARAAVVLAGLAAADTAARVTSGPPTSSGTGRRRGAVRRGCRAGRRGRPRARRSRRPRPGRRARG